MADKKHHHTNRLINEKSPYLQQHAHNPVDWYPWGDEAFRAAREQDKPIFLSIGYATCHWCHVMERESFEDLEVADFLNQVFVCIKVDREELPEVDSLYMEFAQSMMSGSAGWPLNVILTPELEPFFAATYLPPRSQQGLMGLIDLVMRIDEIWSSEERERVINQAGKIVEVFQQSVHTEGDELPPPKTIVDTSEMLFKMADPVYGGMKGSPKFPIGYQSSFLLEYFATQADMRALFLVERTLEMMHRGGIYDHVGGGFSRYSVDEEWFQPHFEKMLYDNAFLMQAYHEAWRATQKPFYKKVAEHIAHYILRDMTHPEGGFYSAEDADSEGKEGYFYTWTFKEILDLLGQDEGALFCKFYEVTEDGNFDERNILHMHESLEEFKEKEHAGAEEILERGLKTLFQAREKRVHPLKDDKILSSWNGLMIHTFAQMGLLDESERAARFIKKYLWKDGVLYRRWRDGDRVHEGGLDEYAFMIRGCLSLFEADRGSEFLEWALEMNKVLERHFKVEGGAYFQTPPVHENILIRKCTYSDAAEPSGNSIQCENLLRLYQFSFKPEYLSHAEDILKAAKKQIDTYPPGYTYHVKNLNRHQNHKAATYVIALNGKEDHLSLLREAAASGFHPHRAVLFLREKDRVLLDSLPSLKEYKPQNGQTTLYVCKRGVCEAPLTDIDTLKSAFNI